MAVRNQVSEEPRRPHHDLLRWCFGACLLIVAAQAVGTGGCALEVQGGQDAQCSSNQDCDDGHVCHVPVCNAYGLCANGFVADGPAPAEEQEPQDCVRQECLAGELVPVFDPSDTFDDFNSCTEDLCDPTTLKPITNPLDFGDACQEGGGSGICGCLHGSTVEACDDEETPICQISCTVETAPEVCDDDNVCTNDSCDTAAGVCVHEYLDGIPAPDQLVGDCQITLCAQGVPGNQTDNTDLPNDDRDCTHDDCVNGVPTYTPEVLDFPCDDDGGTYCDGTGSCVECNADAQCGDTAANCRCRQCQTNACVNLTLGTDAPDCQQANDCQILRCDGAGSYTSVADNGDLPASDNNVCTDDICKDGVPAHDPNSDPCTDDVYCNGTDTCSGGSCSVHSGNPCPGPDGDGDCSESCNESSDNCTANDPSGSACDDGLYCTVTSSCNSSGACSVTSGNPCPGPDGDDDCSETCNETTNDCSTNDPNGSACSDGAYCNGADTCNNGSCSIHAGDPCGPVSDGNCAACNESSDNCSSTEPNGSPCDDGAYCTGVDTCNNGACSNHAGDPCAGNYSDDNCTGGCNEGSNNCTANEPNGSPCDDGAYCTGVDTCNNGACSNHAGDPCAGNYSDDNCTGGCDDGPNNCNGDEPNGSPCNDGTYCNGADTCQGGTCTAPNVDPCQTLLNTCVNGDTADHCHEACNEGSDNCTAQSPAGTLCHFNATCNDYCDDTGSCINS